jgi:predicted transcriptional regulator
MDKKLYEIAANIVQAQASSGNLTPDVLIQSMENVFITLQKMRKAEEEGMLLEQVKASEETTAQQMAAPEIDPQKSIQNDKIVCLECGKEMRQLTVRHLGIHGLSLKEYKQKYGFPLKTPLSAKSLTKARSKAAKERGLPEKLQELQKRRKQEKMEAAQLEAADVKATKNPSDKG